MRDLVIFGAGGHGRDVHQIVRDLVADGADWNVVGFLDGDAKRHGTEIHALPILGDESWLAGRPDTHVVVAIGATAARWGIVQKLTGVGCRNFATLVHPRVWAGRDVEIGTGTVICASTLLTTDLRIGNHAILNLACTVGHDVVLGDFVTLAPGVNISGAVGVGKGCDLGSGSIVNQGVNIGRWSVIGSGAVVVRDLEPNVTAVGVPARVIKTRPEGWQLG